MSKADQRIDLTEKGRAYLKAMRMAKQGTQKAATGHTPESSVQERRPR